MATLFAAVLDHQDPLVDRMLIEGNDTIRKPYESTVELIVKFV